MTIRPDQLYALERDARRLLVAVVTVRDRGTGADEVHDAAAALRQVLPTVRPQGDHVEAPPSSAERLWAHAKGVGTGEAGNGAVRGSQRTPCGDENGSQPMLSPENGYQ